MNRTQWAQAFLKMDAFPFSQENVLGMITWMASEGSLATWNPLATTQPFPHATDFNSAGVKNYATQADGLGASNVTLNNGRYGPIITQLQHGDNAVALCAAIHDSPWGSKPTPQLLDNVRKAPITYGNVLIGGSKPVPDPPVPAPPGSHLAAPIVGGCYHPAGSGYWMVGADGGVFAFGGCVNFGGMAGKPLVRPIIGMAASLSGNGYSLFGADGGVFSFGDAGFFGSVPGIGIGPAA